MGKVKIYCAKLDLVSSYPASVIKSPFFRVFVPRVIGNTLSRETIVINEILISYPSQSVSLSLGRPVYHCLGTSSAYHYFHLQSPING